MSRPGKGTLDRTGPLAVAGLTSVGFLALLYVIEVVDVIDDHRLDGYGVQPRSAHGLLGILFAPLLHHGWGHLAANSIPALVLGFLVLVSGIARGLQVTGVIWLVAGVGVWLAAPASTNHLGASSLIFGWLVYLIVRGVRTRAFTDIVVGVLVFLVYGTVLLGVLPGQPGVSWQGHLFGAVGGALAALLLAERERSRRSVI